MLRPGAVWLIGAAFAAALCGCGGKQPPDSPAVPAAASQTQPAPQAPSPPARTADAADIEAEALAADTELNLAFDNKPWKGDLDGMIERRAIRVLVPYSKTFYFIDNGVQRGLMYEMMNAFDDAVNKSHKLRKLQAEVIFLPVSRDRLLPDLEAGLGDIAAANLTITPQRQARVDFSAPLARDVKEIVVASAQAPALSQIDDLSGREVYIRKDSSYYESLTALNRDLNARGKKPIVLREAPPSFEDEDILEMVNAGLVPYTVVDRYLGTFWKQVYTDLQVREDLIVHEGGDIAFAIRKESPLLRKELDAFVKHHARGTTFGNVVIKRYLQDTRWVKNATNEAEMKKLNELRTLFQKYGDQYEIDWVLMAAQGFQESGLDQNVKSRVGAIGVMQIMPATGKDMGVGDIRKVDPNIHAGIKYVRFMMDEYYKDEAMDELNKVLFAFASYNAGPNRIRSLRKLTAQRGLDPNVWFNNVERIVAEKVGRETVQYVANIFKYYVAYTLVMEQRERREALRERVAESR